MGRCAVVKPRWNKYGAFAKSMACNRTVLAFGLINIHNLFTFKKLETATWPNHLGYITALISLTALSLYSGGIQSGYTILLATMGIMAMASRKNGYTLLSLVFICGLFAANHFTSFPNLIQGTSATTTSFLMFICMGLVGYVYINYHWFTERRALLKQLGLIETDLRKKDTLLKEIHHRVKNNLQTVSSLLNLQSKNIEEPHIRALFKNSQNRVICMAMVHEMLYQRDDLSKIEYRSYVEQLTGYLMKTAPGGRSRVKLNINVPEIKLNVDTAIPLGLLINETITNSLKYGFTDSMEGEIYIGLTQAENQHFILEIGDNGKGFPAELETEKLDSMGLKLINSLARQLKGSIERDTQKEGTNYIVKFQESQKHFHSVA
jgi:two-component sensor histidine kinase